MQEIKDRILVVEIKMYKEGRENKKEALCATRQGIETKKKPSGVGWFLFVSSAWRVKLCCLAGSACFKD